MIQELLQNPEQYRVRDNYKGTNIIFPVEFEGIKLIVKMPRLIGSLVNCYYTLQDNLFFGTRKFSNGEQRLQREAKCLEKLIGLHSPKLFGYNNGVLAREYLDGKDFRELILDADKKKALEKGFYALMEIHNKDVVIGDAHIKNIFIGNDIYWMDFDGIFDESDITHAKAVDVLKFVYSTYSATRDSEITKYSAELAASNTPGNIKSSVRKLVNFGLSSIKLWFPTRLPLDGKLNNEIKRILENS